MYRRTFFFFLLCIILGTFVPAFTAPTYAQVNECTDGRDNNGDGKIDAGRDVNGDGIVDSTETSNTGDPICIRTGGQCETARCESSLQTRNQYNPNVTLSSDGKSFNGISFSGVGGAIAACTNAGKWAVKGAISLFGGQKSGRENIAAKGKQGLVTRGGEPIPVNASSVQQETEKAKQELNRMNNTTECLNGVAYAVAKNLLQQVIGKQLNYVNTGLGGNSLYLQDAAAYYRNISNDKIAAYTNSIQTRNPIFGNALRSAINQQATGLSDGLIGRSMNTPQAQQYNEFMNDFRVGGWSAWLNTTQVDSNNPVGAMLGASDELNRAINSQIQNTRDELQWSGGFFNMKQCEEFSKTERDATTGDFKCLPGKEKSVTPGRIIADQTSRVVQSPVVQLELADGINEVLGAWTDRMLNNLLNKGLQSLQGAGYAGLTDANGNTISSSLSTSTPNTLGFTSVNGTYNANDFDISRPQYLHAIIRAQKNYLNRVLDSQVAIQSIVPQAGRLDYCLPGPNTGWVESTDNAMQSFVSGMTEESPDTVAQKLGSVFGGTIFKLGESFGIGDRSKSIFFVNQNLTLTDRTTGQGIGVGSTVYEMHNAENSGGVQNKFREAYSILKPYLESQFSTTNVASAFTAAGAPDAPAKVGAAYDEAGQLISYDQGVASIEAEYTQTVGSVEASIAELEAIRAEVNLIVAGRGNPGDANYREGAKRRYIRERAAAGNPIAEITTEDTNGDGRITAADKLLCIDAAYVINTGPITGNPRIEDPRPAQADIDFSNQSSSYFYQTLPFYNN